MTYAGKWMQLEILMANLSQGRIYFLLSFVVPRFFSKIVHVMGKIK